MASVDNGGNMVVNSIYLRTPGTTGPDIASLQPYNSGTLICNNINSSTNSNLNIAPDQTTGTLNIGTGTTRTYGPINIGTGLTSGSTAHINIGTSTATNQNIIFNRPITCPSFINGSLPINCIETYYVTTLATPTVDWGGVNTGSTTYLVIPTTGTKTIYKPNTISISALSDIKIASADGTYYIYYTGLYEIKISILFKYTGTTTVSPRIQIFKNGLVQSQEQSIVPVIQSNTFGTISSTCISSYTSSTFLSFNLSANRASSSFTNVVPTASYSLSDLSISIKYLGLYS
jgi:hypothetical protein